jgi:hypothetical protein
MSGFSIDPSGASASFQLSQLTSGAQRGVGGVDSDGDNDGSSAVRRPGRGHAFMQSVLQTLSQLGLTAPNQDAGSATGDQQSVGQALHAFMHSLFHALRGSESAQGSEHNSASQSEGNASASQPNYGDLTSALQTLLQNLTSAADAPAANGSESDLQTAFQNLVQALGTSGSSGSSTPPTLQGFVQTLLQDLSNKGGNLNSASLNPAGNVVATAA